jgi:hypothetical protein
MLKDVYGVAFERNDVPPTEAVGMGLFDGLRKKSKLQKVFAGDGADEKVNSSFSPGVVREINFYLALNRHGRMLLRPPGGSEPPSGIWPRVLAKITYWSTRHEPALSLFAEQAQNTQRVTSARQVIVLATGTVAEA